jgi:hypothetical protein
LENGWITKEVAELLLKKIIIKELIVKKDQERERYKNEVRDKGPT